MIIELIAGVLKVCGNSVKQNLARLSYEPYIDDQIEIDEIWRVSEEDCKYLKENVISSELKMHLIRTLVENLFFDEYDCYDATWNLANCHRTLFEKSRG